MTKTVLLVPGINNSGATHWQTLWEIANPTFQRIRVVDWDRPSCASWVDAIEDSVSSMGGAVFIVAHSLGCLPVIEWVRNRQVDKIGGALFVSVPDPNGSNFPVEATGFKQLRLQQLPFKSIVVSSEDDPYGSPDFARRCADGWGSRFVGIGAAGHINASSNLGVWDEGMNLLHSLWQS